MPSSFLFAKFTQFYFDYIIVRVYNKILFAIYETHIMNIYYKFTQIIYAWIYMTVYIHR